MRFVLSGRFKSSNVEASSPSFQIFLLSSLFVLFVFLALSSLMFPIRESLTYDESSYFKIGSAILSRAPSTAGDDNIMPAMALYPVVSAAIMAVIPASILPSDQEGSQKIYLAKPATTIVSLLLAFYVFL